MCAMSFMAEYRQIKSNEDWNVTSIYGAYNMTRRKASLMMFTYNRVVYRMIAFVPDDQPLNTWSPSLHISHVSTKNS